MNKFGISFSLSHLLGLAGLKESIAKTTGMPTTENGLKRKIGGMLLKAIFKG